MFRLISSGMRGEVLFNLLLLFTAPCTALIMLYSYLTASTGLIFAAFLAG